jgi:hypothetical protein
LHWAAFDGSFQAVKALLELGADPDLKTSDGSTPYDYCSDAATKELLRPYHEERLKQEKAAEEEKARRDASARLNGSWLWSSELPDTITHTHQEPSQQYLLTEIFNFAAENRILLTEKLQTGQGFAPETKRFDEISSKEVEEARAHLAQAKGSAPAEIRKPPGAGLPIRRVSL